MLRGHPLAIPLLAILTAFWTSSPTYFAIRCGVLLLIGTALYAAERWLPRSREVLLPLERLGRRSLFVYWVHVELVYGYATWPLHRRLWLWQTVTAYLVFIALMYLAVMARERVGAAWLARRHGPPATQPLSI